MVDIDGEIVVGNLVDKAANATIINAVIVLRLVFYGQFAHEKGRNVGIKDRRNKHGEGPTGIHQFLMRQTFRPVAGPSHALNSYRIAHGHTMFLAKEVHLGKQVAEGKVTSCQSFAACKHQCLVQQLVDNARFGRDGGFDTAEKFVARYEIRHFPLSFFPTR